MPTRFVTAAERYEAAFTLLDAQQGDPAERGWLRLLAAAQRRHEDWDQAFAWVEEAVRLAATAGDPSLDRPRAGLARAAHRLSWRLSHRDGDHGRAPLT